MRRSDSLSFDSQVSNPQVLRTWDTYTNPKTNFQDFNLELQATIYKWLFQLDDSQSLHRKWLFHQTSIYKWLFGVPGSHTLANKCFLMCFWMCVCVCVCHTSMLQNNASSLFFRQKCLLPRSVHHPKCPERGCHYQRGAPSQEIPQRSTARVLWFGDEIKDNGGSISQNIIIQKPPSLVPTF